MSSFELHSTIKWFDLFTNNIMVILNSKKKISNFVNNVKHCLQTEVFSKVSDIILSKKSNVHTSTNCIALGWSKTPFGKYFFNRSKVTLICKKLIVFWYSGLVVYSHFMDIALSSLLGTRYMYRM